MKFNMDSEGRSTFLTPDAELKILEWLPLVEIRKS
jgi:hypothetical protein